MKSFSTKRKYEFYAWCNKCDQYDLQLTIPKKNKVTTICCNCGLAKQTKIS